LDEGAKEGERAVATAVEEEGVGSFVEEGLHYLVVRASPQGID